MFSSNPRVCVVGGGPAGLGVAIALKRFDCDVTVVDCASPPVDKACGEGLMPDCIAAMRELGIQLPPDVGFAFQGIRFTDNRSSVSADFPNGAGRGLRRTVLHKLLIEHATKLGVAIVWNAKHARVTAGGVSLDGQIVDAELIVGADGQNSQIRRQTMQDQIVREQRRYAFRRHYRIAPWSRYMELHWGSRSQIYVTPIAPDEICVVSISRDRQARLGQGLFEIPEVRQRLKKAVLVSKDIGALSVSRTLESVHRGNVVLIGDASGSVDAVTGEGICLGFHQARALAEAFRCGDLDMYERLHRKLMRRPQIMASLLLTLERPRFRQRTLASMARYPLVFETLLGVHVGASPVRDLWSPRLLHLGGACLPGLDRLC